MPRFFTENFDETAKRAVIEGNDAAHLIHSLRKGEGDPVTVCNGRGRDYACTIVKITDGRVELDLTGGTPSTGEPPIRVTLFQALPKGDKLDWIIQKSVELGVSEIVPLISARCVSRPDEKGFQKKLDRYGRIAAEAAKQCGRGILPAVRPALNFSALPARLTAFDASLFFYEHARRRLSSIPFSGKHTMAIIIGSEGGFEEREAALLRETGALEASLGNRILRCETASLAALAAIWYAVGEL